MKSPRAIRREPCPARAASVGCLLVAAVIGCGGRELVEFDDPTRTPRRTLEASEYAVVAGTPWAAEAMEDVPAGVGTPSSPQSRGSSC